MPSCSAIDCSNTPEKGFRMFCFPREETRRKQWIRNVSRKYWNPTNSSRLCELHFEASQFESRRLDGAKKIKPNAVPTLFAFSNPPERIDSPPRKSLYEDNIDANEENPEPLPQNILPANAPENVPASAPTSPDQTINILDSDFKFDPDEEDYEEQPTFKKASRTNNNENSCEMEVFSDHNEDNDSEFMQSGLVQCSHCSSTFFTFDEWEMHMKLHKVDSEITIDDNSLIEDITSENQTDSSSKNKKKIGGVSKRSYACPIDYCTSISSTAVGLEKHMQVHGFTRKFSADLPQVYLTRHDLLLCIRCGHQTIEEFPMRVHRILHHHSKNKNVTWVCPRGSDCFQSSCKSIFIKHLEDFHQLNKEDYTHQAFGELKMMDYQPSTATGKVFDCHFCEFSTRLKSEVFEHVQHVHPKRQCHFCETMIQGEFQMFWHTYTVHGNVADYHNWRLQCTICSCENLVKHSYQHGGTHKNQIIKFKTIYQNEVKGIVPFLYILKQYAKNAEAAEQINIKAEGNLDNNDFEAWDLADSDTHNQVPEIFTATDKETSNGDDADLNFSCKSCYFATKNGHYLSIHQQMYHKRANQTHFFCPQPNCTFESQYRCNFKRHLLNAHEIDKKNFQISNKNVIKPMPIIETLTCESCNFKAVKSEILNMHVQLLHSVGQRTEADPFWCPIENCIVTSPYKSNFKRHLMRVHHVTMHALGITEIGTSFGLRHEAPSTFEANNDDAIKGKGKFAFKKHIQKQMEMVEGNEVSNKEFNATKSKTEYECSEAESECSGFDHYLGRRSDFDLFWRPKFSCPFEGCSLVIGKRLKFRRHLTLFHNLNDYKLQEWKGMDYFIAQYAKTFHCLKCGFDGIDMKELKNHFRMEHRITGTHNKAKPIKKNSRAAKGFLLKCTQCTFATNLKSRAHLHGFRHVGINKKRSVVFRNYIDCKRQDDLVYRYPDKNMLKCPKCDFRALIATDLTRHMLNFHSLRARNHLSLWNIRITKQRMARRTELRQRNQEKASDIKEKELCKILVTQNKSINNGSALEEEVIKIVFVDDPDDISEQVTNENLVICTICEKQFLCTADLLIHIDAEHILVPKPATPNVARIKTGFVPPGIEGRVSFICCLCKQVLFSANSLKNHTSIHSKAAKDSNLKVTFTKFKGDLILNKVTIKADPNYVSRKSNYVRWAAKRTPKDKIPVLDYAPKLKVFSCEECNFKTNDADNLAKHKKLHWSNEKEEAYKSKKWFTCERCSYYSFDAEKFEKHAEMHKISDNFSLYVDLIK